jgi:hypothetical protein
MKEEANVQASRDNLILKISVALGIYYIAVIAYSIYAQMYYFADGSNFFIHMLENGDFIRLNPNRIYAHYVTQFLPIAAMDIFGIKNYAVLSYLYGINLYLPIVAGLWVCYSIVKKSNPYLMVFPLLSLFGVSMNSMMHLAAGQAHVISSVFWPILFYMTLKEEYSLRDYVIFFALALVFMKSYESAVFLGPILAFISLPRIFRKGGHQKLFWAVATMFFFASIIIALREILHPFDPGNETNFIMSVFVLYRHYPAVLSLFYIFAISVFFFLPALLERYFSYIMFFLLGLTLLVSFSPLVAPSLIKPSLQYSARVLMAYMIPPMGVLFYFIAGNRISVSENTWKRVGMLTAILIFGQISWQMIAVSQWNGFRQVFREELGQHRGLLLFEDSVLSRNSIGKQLIKPFIIGWTVPTMSILWSRGGNVSSIITANQDFTTWQPFDPGNIEDLPKVERFGFSYKTYRESPHDVDSSYALNTKLNFSASGNYRRYIKDGWSFAEADHVWTEGKKAFLTFKTAQPGFDPTIDIEVSPFLAPPRITKQKVILFVNDEKVGEHEVTASSKIQFTVPRALWAKKQPAVVEFRLPDAAAPSSLGVGNDRRVLSLAFRSLTIH